MAQLQPNKKTQEHEIWWEVLFVYIMLIIIRPLPINLLRGTRYQDVVIPKNQKHLM